MTHENLNPYLTGKIVELSDTDKILLPNLVMVKTDSFFEHLVSEDDTIQSVANRYFNGDTRYFEAICEFNDIEDPISLLPGSVLKIPSYGN